MQNALALAIAATGSFAALVPIASVAILAVYLLVALSALALQRRPDQPAGAFSVPAAIPLGAAAIAIWMLSKAKPGELALEAAVVTMAAALALIRRRTLADRH